VPRHRGLRPTRAAARTALLRARRRRAGARRIHLHRGRGRCADRRTAQGKDAPLLRAPADRIRLDRSGGAGALTARVLLFLKLVQSFRSSCGRAGNFFASRKEVTKKRVQAAARRKPYGMTVVDGHHSLGRRYRSNAAPLRCYEFTCPRSASTCLDRTSRISSWSGIDGRSDLWMRSAFHPVRILAPTPLKRVSW